MRTKWLKKQKSERGVLESNVEVRTDSMLIELARRRFDGATVERSLDVVLFGLRYQCWRCSKVSTPVVGMMEPGGDVDSEEFVVCDEEELLALAWRFLPGEARERFRVGEVRRRYSKTIRAEYLSNGCADCGALFGDFFLIGEALPEALATEGMAALTELAVVSIPTSTWTSAYESRWAYQPEDDE